jgi:hypothetical protein
MMARGRARFKRRLGAQGMSQPEVVAVRDYSASVKFNSIIQLHDKDLNVTMGTKARASLDGATFLGWGE